jgi:hypothetical protein
MPSAHKPLDSSHPAVRIAAAILLALTFLWCIYWFVHAWHYWEDDAYIHLEFARSLAAGRGFTFNNRVVAGDTAPLWVFLLAATHTLIPGWLVADKPSSARPSRSPASTPSHAASPPRFSPPAPTQPSSPPPSCSSS